jgi:hypothetical protein
MSEEKVLTKEIAEQGGICDGDASGYTAIEEAAVESLAKTYLWLLRLDGLSSLSDVAAESLAKHEGVLHLNGLTSLSDAAAESLSLRTGILLSLNGLTELSEAAAESLSKFPGELCLNGLTSLSSAPLAKKMASMRMLDKEAARLDFKNLTSLSDAAAESLSSHKGTLWLKRLKSLSEAAAESLSRHQGILYLSSALTAKVDAPQENSHPRSEKEEDSSSIHKCAETSGLSDSVAGEEILTKEIAERFLQNDSDDWINLEEFAAIEDSAAETLAGNPGPWDLNGLTKLSAAVAESLSRQKCQKSWIGNGLYLNGLKNICDEVAQCLSCHKGVLEMNSLKKLSDSAAESLSLRWGTLSLDGLTQLSAAAAESFSGFFGIGNSRPWLSLDGLTELSDAAAEKLSLFQGSKLDLRGLRKLSDSAAKSLSQMPSDTELILNGLTELSDAAAESLSKFKYHIYLRGVDDEGKPLLKLSDAAAKSFSKCENRTRIILPAELQAKIDSFNDG